MAPAPPLSALLAGLLVLAGQEPETDDPPPFGEGPLRNTTLLPSHEAAQAQLAAGDGAWSRALGGGEAARLERVAAFDGWRGALEASATGDGVPLVDPAAPAGLWPDRDHTHGRRAEGVEVAVLRRLAALSPGDRAAWRERFGPGAQALLDAAPYDREVLAEIERRAPLTRAAAVGALRLADGALEAGLASEARTWLGRAEHHAAELAEAEVVRAACSRRRAVLGELDPPAAVEPWETASSLRLVRFERIETTAQIGSDPRPAPLGRGLESGACFLADRTLVVQTPRAVSWWSPDALRDDRLGKVARIALRDVLDLEGERMVHAASAGGWSLRPATDGRDVVLVVGRGQAGRVVRDLPIAARGNHLACVRFLDDGRTRVRWVLSDDGVAVEDGEPEPLVEAIGFEGHLELQPGPLVAGGAVYVQARRLASPSDEGVLRGGDQWLLALDLDTGALRWRRFLTRAADLRDDGVRGGSRADVPTTGMPLALAEGVLVVGTNVGLASAFDAADGRLLWSLRTQRRRVEDAGWPGSRPPVTGPGPDGRGTAWITPSDSEHAYALPLGAALGAELFLSPPERRGRLIDLVGARGDERVFLARDGRHAALRFTRGDGPLRSSLYLDRDERFAGAGLAGRERVLVSSDRALYLFSREGEYRLLDAAPLPDLGAGVGGEVVARGDRIAVVGRDTLWVLQAR